MLLYTASAPNPLRVAVFIAEKDISVPTREVSLRDGEHFGTELSAKNPDHTVPFVELSDGTIISESLAICRYLEAMHPDPPLFGRDAREMGLVEMWLRKLELRFYQPTQDAFRNSRPGFAGRALPGYRQGLAQIPELVDRSNVVASSTLQILDETLKERPFIVGDSLTMPDVVAHTTLLFAQRTKFAAVANLERYPDLRRWADAMASRPSASIHEPS